MSRRKLITIGIPVLNEELNIVELIERLKPVLLRINQSQIDVEIIVNNNASSDTSIDLLNNWAVSDSRVKINNYLIKVSFQESILNLLKECQGDAFILLQSDLQDPPELLEEFIANWRIGHRIVAGVITRRTERIVQRTIRKIFYRILKAFSDGEIITGFQDFYLLDKIIVENLKQLSPEGLFLRGHISSRFGNVKTVPYVREERKNGISNFNFPHKYSLALDGLLLFGTRFIRIISTISFSIFCLGALGTLGILIGYSLGFRPGMTGWASLGVILLTLLSLFGMVAALILEYLVRIYRFQVLAK